MLRARVGNTTRIDWKIRGHYVIWSYYTWHAVIPLYRSNINEDFIEEAVAISIPAAYKSEKTIMYFDRSVIDSTKKIIEYYETCKNPNESQRYFMDMEEQKHQNKYIKSDKIVELLETGSFIPYKLIQQGFRFFQWEKWNFDGLVKSNKMAKEKGPYTRFSVWPGLK